MIIDLLSAAVSIMVSEPIKPLFGFLVLIMALALVIKIIK